MRSSYENIMKQTQTAGRALSGAASNTTFPFAIFLFAVFFLFSGDALAQSGTAEPRFPTPSRVGIEEGKPVSLTLVDSIKLALENNREIEVEHINAKQVESELRAAEAAYDPHLTYKQVFERSSMPTASVLNGGVDGKLTYSALNASATFAQRLRTGGSYEIDLNSSRIETNNAFATLNPQYNNQISFGLRQPLLKNRSIDEHRLRLLVGSKKLNVSDIQFRRKVLDIISQVQLSYWDLVLARANAEVAREALNLGKTQHEQIKRLVSEGELAPLELIGTQAELDSRQENVFLADESVTRAENALKAILYKDSSAPEWNSPIIPLDEPTTIPVDMTLESARRAARENRSEVEQLKLRRSINDLKLKFYKDQTRNQVDLVVGYTMTGLAGTPKAAPDPISAVTNQLSNRVNDLSAQSGLAPLPLLFNNRLPESFNGSLGQGTVNMFNPRFHSVQVGIQIQLPFFRRSTEEKERLGQELAELQKINVEDQALSQAIEMEVRNALQALRTAHARIEAANASRIAAEVQLASEQRLFSRGASTSQAMLQRQNNLTAARTRVVRAQVDYRKAIIELRKAMGTSDIPEASFVVQVDAARK